MKNKLSEQDHKIQLLEQQNTILNTRIEYQTAVNGIWFSAYHGGSTEDHITYSEGSTLVFGVSTANIGPAGNINSGRKFIIL